MLESSVEAKLVRLAKKKGWTCLKFTPTQRGYPDRLMLKNGLCFFVEVKQEGKDLRPSQLTKAKELISNGFRVYKYDGKFENVGVRLRKEALSVPQETVLF